MVDLTFLRAVVRQPLTIIWLSFLVMDLVALAMVCLALRDLVMSEGKDGKNTAFTVQHVVRSCLDGEAGNGKVAETQTEQEAKKSSQNGAARLL